jgi:type II secretion system protein J
MNKSTCRGFTLIETVVSMLLLAVMGVMGYQAVASVLDANERSRNELAAEAQLHRAWQIIGADLLHLRARTYHDGLGGIELAYATGRLPVVVGFSRGGAVLQPDNPTGLERVRYELDASGELSRSSWPIHLSPREYRARSMHLLEGVRALRFEQLTDDGIFSPIWPPLNRDGDDLLLPKMIRVSIELEDGTSTWRLYPGIENDV